jgi:BASS family bile acid:Na+ symporter
MGIIRFLKDWTLPCAIATGSTAYLTFYYVPQLDAAGDALAPVFDVIFPLFVFLTLLVTFCKVDFHQMLPHRWHLGILVAQVLLVAVTVAAILYLKQDASASVTDGNVARHALLSLGGAG